MSVQRTAHRLSKRDVEQSNRRATAGRCLGGAGRFPRRRAVCAILGTAHEGTARFLRQLQRYTARMETIMSKNTKIAVCVTLLVAGAAAGAATFLPWIGGPMAAPLGAFSSLATMIALLLFGAGACGLVAALLDGNGVRILGVAAACAALVALVLLVTEVLAVFQSSPSTMRGYSALSGASLGAGMLASFGMSIVALVCGIFLARRGGAVRERRAAPRFPRIIPASSAGSPTRS